MREVGGVCLSRPVLIVLLEFVVYNENSNNSMSPISYCEMSDR